MRKITIALIAVGTATLPLMAQRNLNTIDVINVRTVERVPRASWAPQDPADGLWRTGREAINDREWERAATTFRKIRTESAYKSSTYRGQSYYWEAYARVQMGGRSQLSQAQSLLEDMQADFPDDAKKIRDVSTLLATIEGKLANDYGDSQASAKIRASADAAASSNKNSNDCDELEDDDNPRMAALNALLQMDAESAMPILEQIMARRDKCSEVLRTKAVWLIAQKHSARSADILLDAAKNDPNEEVRSQAVFWLGQSGGEKAIDALQEILRTAKSEDVQESALFALSQMGKSTRAGSILRNYATRGDISADLRKNAIFYLSQTGSEENFTFLQDLFGKVSDSDTREQILFAVAQRNSASSSAWLMDRVMDKSLDTDMRKTALFHAAQMSSSKSGLTSSKLVSLYDTMNDTEMKEQLIFAFAQRKDPVFIDKLMDIAKNEKDKELRSNAIFWLGQVGSKDPRVLKFLADLING